MLATWIAAATGGLVIVSLPARALAAAPVPQTFAYTGEPQRYTIPAGTTALDVTITGAGGGGTSGGGGAVVTARVNLDPADGDTIQVMVGGKGRSVTSGPVSASAGYNGGGSAGAVQLTMVVGGGGGASDLRIGSCAATSSCSAAARVIVAGGGGGSGYHTYAYGGSATDWAGSDGGQSSPYYIGGGGRGGTQSAAGAGGPATIQPVSAGAPLPGSAGVGATGGNGGICAGCPASPHGAAVDSAGGGGGGGYYGGGGGGAGNSTTTKPISYSGGGGGAGSSWVRPDRLVGTATVTGAGSADNGSITIAVAGPPAPAVTTPTVNGTDSLGLSWTAPQGGADSYRVYGATASDGPYTAVSGGSCAGTVTGTSCSATGLTAGQAYYFEVSSVLAGLEGQASSPTAPVTAIEPPDAPATPTAAVSGHKAIDVTWASGGTAGRPVTSYTVSMAVDGGTYTAVATGPCSGAATSPCTVSGLTAGSTYTFKVTATNAAGSADSLASDGVVAQQGPAAPALGPVTVAGPGILQVAWTPGTQSNVTYQIGQSTSPTGTFTPVTAGTCTGAPAASPCTVTGLTPGQEYSFQIQAVNGILAGDPSAGSALVTAIDTPAQTGTPVLTVVGDRSLQVTWTSSSPASAPIDTFDVQLSAAGGDYTSVSTGACHNPTASPCVLSGLTAGTAYGVKVTPRNEAGDGPVSAPSTPVTAVQAPEAPTIDSVTPGDGEATVAFTPGAPNGTITGYTVTASPGGNQCTAQPDERSCPVTGLTNGTEYSFTVVAHGDIDSAASAPLTGTPSEAPGPPTATVTAGVAAITVQWTPGPPGSGIDSWIVAASPGPSGCEVAETVHTCVLGATAGTAYTVTVRAVGTYGRDSADATAGPVTPTLPLIPATPPTANAALTTSDGPISTAAPGQQITFVGYHFAPNSSVRLTIYSTPKLLAETVADPAGTVTVTVTLPASLAPGAHTIAALGVNPNGTPYSLDMAVTVPTAGPSLPRTGVAIIPMLLAGLSLVLTGGGLTIAGRPRRRVSTG